MLDFMLISTRNTKTGVEIYPKFIIKKSKDLMIRGGDFYAIWIEDKGLWSTDEQEAIRVIDEEIKQYKDDYKKKYGDAKACYLWDAETGMIDRWHKYCQKQMRDNYIMLDEKLIFSNTDTVKEDYASKRLSYPLEKGSIKAFDKLISTLYSPEERHKIEWAIGSIVSGESKKLQKFMVLYGAAGTGKSTILNIIQKLFDGYYSVFDAKALGSSSSSFALEAFKGNPLVAIQHDGDLSKIEDNTRLNSLVSHEQMTVNEKFKSTYTNDFKCFLFMGTNRPVKITDAKSGLIRRLIDVTPSGNKLNSFEYKQIMKQIDFELGAIAYHCQEIYLENPNYYDNYIPLSMMGASNDFYNFVLDVFHIFKKEDGTTLKSAWEMYKAYCEDAKVPYPFTQRVFKEELKNYFKDYKERFNLEDGTRVRSFYSGFLYDKFEEFKYKKKEEVSEQNHLISFNSTKSIFDDICADCPAQYATSNETPNKKWDEVTTKLSDINTKKLHYVKIPENHIVIDFDIPDENGEKSFEKNLKEASKWPLTYAELSKSGKGIHLHYIYSGDVSKLSRVYDDHIEIKIFTGNSSLRRKLSKCNDIPIATINSGLPLKGDYKMVNSDVIQTEKGLRTLIKRNLNKEIHPGTKPSIDFIYKILEDAYTNGVKYDVTNMRGSILSFAANSTHHADYCIKLVNKMQFKSEEASDYISNEEQPIVFYDVEVFPNLFLVNWKFQGKDKPIVRMINPKPHEVEDLLKYRLVGFNNRRYDNHMLWARIMGYSEKGIFDLSQKIITENKGFFGEAYNISYTDIYDFCSVKQSLKKWEIELGIHHKELGLPWDQPVPEDKWIMVAEYCDNDVIATEVVFDNRQADFVARQVQVDLAKLIHGINDVSVNDTTNTLSTKIIFGNNRKPQDEFNWRDMSQPVSYERYNEYKRRFGEDYTFRVFDDNGLPQYRTYVPGEKLPKGWSILPFFPGYEYKFGKSTYMDDEIGEGGRVYSKPGMYVDVWDGDISSQHPHSAIAEVIFGPRYTKIFSDLVKARVAVKHLNFEEAGTLLGGALKPYLNEEQAPDLAYALKIVINSIYGLTSASFVNRFRDPNNIDNIVAKRGALFMTLLKSEVEKRGFNVSHIKTDSIKIPNATSEIMDFVIKFGREFGYEFETEANFEKFCLVNDAVYIAKFKDGKNAGKWTATGKQFAVPYVFKTLFSNEPIEFSDMCETFSVSKGDLYLDMNENLPDVSLKEKELDKIVAKAKKSGITLDISGNSGDGELDSLVNEIQKGHNLIYVGRVGQFTPILPGNNGGILYRVSDGKNYAASGSTGFRWLESETVKNLGIEDKVDKSFYNKLVDAAVDTISKYGDFEWFISDDPIDSEKDLDTPPWLMACGKESCIGCSHLNVEPFDMDCDLGYDISDLIEMNRTDFDVR